MAYSFTGAFAIDAMTDPDTPITWRQRREAAGSGALGDLGAHVIAMARALIGEFDSVAALSKITVADRPEPAGNFGYGEQAAENAPRQEVENDDITMVLASFDSGAIGTLEASRVSSGRAYDLVVAIHEGRKTWPDFRDGQRVCEVMDAVEQAAAAGQLIELISSGQINPETLVTNTFSLAEAASAFDALVDPNRDEVKILIDCSGE